MESQSQNKYLSDKRFNELLYSSEINVSDEEIFLFVKEYIKRHQTKNKNQKVIIFNHDEKGLVHSNGMAPAVISYYDTQQTKIKYRMHYKHGKIHNLYGPAYIHYYNQTPLTKYCETYMANDKIHRDDNKPAVIIYNKKGQVSKLEYYVNDIKIKEEIKAE